MRSGDYSPRARYDEGYSDGCDEADAEAARLTSAIRFCITKLESKGNTEPEEVALYLRRVIGEAPGWS